MVDASVAESAAGDAFAATSVCGRLLSGMRLGSDCVLPRDL